jgi:exodeoxyribonuclease VII large subunit
VEARLMRIVMPAAHRLDDAREELARGMSAAIALRERRLELASRDLAATSPDAVLARGYAVVRRLAKAPLEGSAGAGGAAIRDSGEIAPGDELDITFARGGARAKTLEVRN